MPVAERITTVAARMTEEEKARFFETAQRVGITPSNAIRVLANNFAVTGILPATTAPVGVEAGVAKTAEQGGFRVFTDEVVARLTTEPLGGPYSWRVNYPSHYDE